MARQLRSWDSPSSRASSVSNANENITYWHARQSQDAKNTALRKGLKQAKRKLDYNAQRYKGRSALVEKQGKGLASQAKAVERRGKQANSQFTTWAKGWQARQQQKAYDFKAQRDRAYKDYVNQMAKRGGLNKEGKVPLKDERAFKKTWDQRWSAIESRAQSEYNARARGVQGSVQAASSAYQSQVSAYQRAAKKQQQLYKQYQRAERRYGRARSAYEEGYYEI